MLTKILFFLSGSSRFQYFLENLIRHANFLLGIGAGTDILESGEVLFLRQLCRERFNLSQRVSIFDVGANQGQFLSAILKELRATAFQIHAFEPSLQTFEILSKEIPATSYIILNNLALGNQSGTTQIFSEKAGSGLASLSQRRLTHFGLTLQHTEQIQIDTLDHYCGQRNILEIDLLKLDVEGHELEVLQGASRMFDEQRIRIVMFEFGGACIDTRIFFQDFFYFFKDRYPADLYRLMPSGALYRIHKYREHLEQFQTSNYVAFLK